MKQSKKLVRVSRRELEESLLSPCLESVVGNVAGGNGPPVLEMRVNGCPGNEKRWPADLGEGSPHYKKSWRTKKTVQSILKNLHRFQGCPDEFKGSFQAFPTQ